MINRVILGLENKQTPFVNYLLTFIFAVFIRHYLEAYSQVTNYLDLPGYMLFSDIIHFGLSYINLAFLLMLVFYVATNEPILKIARVVLPAFVLLLLAPLLDLVFTRGFGHSILYLQPGYQIDIVRAYLSVGGGFKGVSVGIKCEIIAALALCFLYFRQKKLAWIVSIFYVWLIYSVMFLWGSSPFLLKGLFNILDIGFEFSGYLMIQYYLLLNFVLLLIVSYLAQPVLFMAIFCDARWLRIMHYELLLLLGVTVGMCTNQASLLTQLRLNPEIISSSTLVSISLFFASIFSIITNNVADRKIDQISNQRRPLITLKVDLRDYLMVGYVALLLSLSYSFLVSPQAFLSMAAVIGAYYLYSMSPIRFKRVPLLSKIVIAFNSVVLLVLGYLLVQGGRYQFPFTLIFIMLTCMTVAGNVIDLKDVKGDQADKINTLPILLGEKNAKRIIGLAYIVLYSGFVCLVSSLYWLFVFVAAGVAQFYLINKKHYHEWQVIAFSNLCLFVLALILFVEKT